MFEKFRPTNNELSKLHEAEVHIFSDSVLCIGEGANAESNEEFAKLRVDNLVHIPKRGTRIYGHRVRFLFHMFPAARTNETTKDIDKLIA